MIICIGKDNTFLNDGRALLKVLWQIAEVHYRLQDPTYSGYGEVDLNKLERLIKSMMVGFYDAFHVFDKVDCGFIKYHFLLHLIWVLREWASMGAVDTCFGEVKHKVVKAMYK